MNESERSGIPGEARPDCLGQARLGRAGTVEPNPCRSGELSGGFVNLVSNANKLLQLVKMTWKSTAG